MIFIDTNIIIRYLTRDDPHKAARCLKLLEKIEANKVKAFTSEAIIAETVYILESKKLYNLKPAKIKALLYPIIDLAGLKLAKKEVFLEALEIFSDYKLDFEDALAVARIKNKGIKYIYSYDKDFDKLPGITRKEP